MYFKGGASSFLEKREKKNLLLLVGSINLANNVCGIDPRCGYIVLVLSRINDCQITTLFIFITMFYGTDNILQNTISPTEHCYGSE